MLRPPCCHIFCCFLPPLLHFFLSVSLFLALSDCPTFLRVQWFRRHQSGGEVHSVICSLFSTDCCQSVAAFACICTVRLHAVQKTPLYCTALYYFNPPRSLSCSNALWYLLTFKQPSIHSLFLYVPVCIRVEPRVTQSFLQLLVPGAGTLFSHICTSRRVPESVLFTPKHSLTGVQCRKKHTTP